jgi:hypothetical protein
LLAGHLEENRNPSIAPSRRESTILKMPASDCDPGWKQVLGKMVLEQKVMPAAPRRGIDRPCRSICIRLPLGLPR